MGSRPSSSPIQMIDIANFVKKKVVASGCRCVFAFATTSPDLLSYSRTSRWSSSWRNRANVLARPSASGIRARQPSSASWLTSNCFIGVPSSLLASQWISSWKPFAAAKALASSRIVRFRPVPTLRDCSYSDPGCQCCTANT